MFGFQEETTDPPHGNAKIPKTTNSERKEGERIRGVKPHLSNENNELAGLQFQMRTMKGTT